MLTLIEAAARLGVTAATLRQQIHNGSLKARKVGRDWTVSEREVERYRREHRRGCRHPRWLLSGTIGLVQESCADCGTLRVTAAAPPQPRRPG